MYIEPFHKVRVLYETAFLSVLLHQFASRIRNINQKANRSKVSFLNILYFHLVLFGTITSGILSSLQEQLKRSV